MKIEPEWVNSTRDGYWTCPPGFTFMRCHGCGHNFWDQKPVQQGSAQVVKQLCEWCLDETA